MFKRNIVFNALGKGLLTAVFIGSSCVVSARSREIPVSSGRSVRLQVDSFAELMVKEISLAKKNSEKFRILGRAEDQILSLRENNVSQTAQDEAYMDLMISVFDAIPDEKDFKKSECEKYESDLMNEFDPTADDEPQIPAVKPGWAALEALCK